MSSMRRMARARPSGSEAGLLSHRPTCGCLIGHTGCIVVPPTSAGRSKSTGGGGALRLRRILTCELGGSAEWFHRCIPSLRAPARRRDPNRNSEGMSSWPHPDSLGFPPLNFDANSIAAPRNWARSNRAGANWKASWRTSTRRSQRSAEQPPRSHRAALARAAASRGAASAAPRPPGQGP